MYFGVSAERCASRKSSQYKSWLYIWISATVWPKYQLHVLAAQLFTSLGSYGWRRGLNGNNQTCRPYVAIRLLYIVCAHVYLAQFSNSAHSTKRQADKRQTDTAIGIAPPPYGVASVACKRKIMT